EERGRERKGEEKERASHHPTRSRSGRGRFIRASSSRSCCCTDRSSASTFGSLFGFCSSLFPWPGFGCGCCGCCCLPPPCCCCCCCFFCCSSCCCCRCSAISRFRFAFASDGRSFSVST